MSSGLGTITENCGTLAKVGGSDASIVDIET